MDVALTLVLGALVAGALLLDVELPWGGTVPLGHAIAIAFAQMLPGRQYVAVILIAVVATWPIEARRQSPGRALSLVASLMLSGAAALVAERAAHALLEDVGSLLANQRILVETVAAGVAFLGVDVVARGRLLADDDDRVRARYALPLYLTLLCVAGLLAVGYEEWRWWALVIAAIPLLVTRFSFHRYHEARETYRQTIQALSVLPEVAGMAGLGHGERTAVYAEAAGHELGLPPSEVDRIATAARLHHIGQVSVPEPAALNDPDRVGPTSEVAAEILRETGFLSDVADLVAAAAAPGPCTNVAPAVVRVASSLDELIGMDETAAGAAMAALLNRHDSAIERRVAITLVGLCDARPGLVRDAIAAGAPYVVRTGISALGA